MKTLLVSIVTIIIATALIWLGQLFGFWWGTVIVGLVLGFTVKPARLALLLAMLGGGLGWGLPLLYHSFYLAIGRTAAVVASIVGIGSTNGWVVIALTILLDVLLCLSAAWVGIALRQVLGFRVRIT